MLQSELILMKNLYSNKNPRVKTICKNNKLLTTTTLESKLKNVLNCIINLQKKFPSENIYYVEIGVKYGGSLRYMLENTKCLNVFGIGIDLFEDFSIEDPTNTHKGDVANRQEMLDKFRESGYDNVELYKGDSSTIIDILLDKMDHVVCFIDGNHTYHGVKLDYEAIKKKMNNGYIIFDDIDPLWVGVRQFYLELPQNIKVQSYRDYGITKYRL